MLKDDRRKRNFSMWTILKTDGKGVEQETNVLIELFPDCNQSVASS